MKRTIQPLFALVLAALLSTAVAAESISISEAHARRLELAGTQITVTGTVIKVNNGIMNRNFIHVQDGTGSGNTDRLVFTSEQTAVVGDVITATGTVALDIDFGMGYFYPTLIEQATLELAKHPKT